MKIILEPLKTFGVMTVYLRKPKPHGCKPYCVVNEDSERILEDFDRLRDANNWAERNSKG